MSRFPAARTAPTTLHTPMPLNPKLLTPKLQNLQTLNHLKTKKSLKARGLSNIGAIPSASGEARALLPVRVGLRFRAWMELRFNLVFRVCASGLRVEV